MPVSRGLGLLLLLALPSCFLYEKVAANCHDHGCQAGQYCPDNGDVCQPGTGPGTDMSMPADLTGKDLASLPDLLPPADLRPECATESDCPANSGLTCKAGKCVACALHTDCDSLVCDVYQQNGKGGSGKCLDLSTVIYVDNKNGGACSGITGNQIDPVCSIPEAVAKQDMTKTNIRVKASSAFYAPLTLTAGKTATIYGPAAQGGSAKIGGSIAAAAVMELGSSTLLIDGMDISTGVIGVRCAGPATNLTLHRGTLTGFSDGAMIVTDCKLEMDRMTVSGNGSGGALTSNVILTGAKGYSITNSFIIQNNTQASAVIKLDSASTGRMRFTTVADNMTASVVAAGLDCNSVTSGPDNQIQDSIFFGNSRDPINKVQIIGSCALSQVVVGIGDKTPNGLNLKNPTFTAPLTGDYRLKAGADNTCCIDQAMGMVDHDYFGAKRPLGKGYDIGAHEAN